MEDIMEKVIILTIINSSSVYKAEEVNKYLEEGYWQPREMRFGKRNAQQSHCPQEHRR